MGCSKRPLEGEQIGDSKELKGFSQGKATERVRQRNGKSLSPEVTIALEGEGQDTVWVTRPQWARVGQEMRSRGQRARPYIPAGHRRSLDFILGAISKTQRHYHKDCWGESRLPLVR
jgi:hypothetical protein